MSKILAPRSIVTGLVMAAMLVWGGIASAQQAKCLAGKTKCMSAKATGKLKCETTAETPGKVVAPDCASKVVAKFDGGADQTKGCFEKLENKKGSDCITQDDTTTAEAAVDSCVTTLVNTIDPPPTDQTKCGAGKKKCVSKYLAALLKCHQAAQTPGKPTDTTACVDKATAKYNGGLVQEKGCFAKLEAKNPNDCQITGDSGTLQPLVQDCVDNFLAVVLNPTTTTTSTTTSSTVVTTTSTTTTSTLPGSGTVLKYALTKTLGKFNYNMVLGLPGALAACQALAPASHVCTYANLQAADGAGDLVGLKDTANMAVTSFWAIDNAAPILQQCNDDAPVTGSGLNWEYGTAHTLSRGNKVPVNSMGHLGSLQLSQDCAILGTPAWVGCCQ